MKKHLTLGLLAFMTAGQALADLPRLGVACTGITQPESMQEIDGGYLNNADCSAIYVKPPKRGDLIVNSWSAINQPYSCNTFNFYKEQLTRIDQRINALIDEQTSPDTTPERQAQLQQSVDIASSHKESLKEELREIDQSVALSMRFIIETQWSDLIRAYQEANPDKAVSGLPFSNSYLTITTRAPETSMIGSMTDIQDGVHSIEVPGFYTRALPVSITEGLGIDLDDNTKPILFNGSLAGITRMRPSGACEAISALRSTPINGSFDLRRLNSMMENTSSQPIIANATYVYSTFVEEKLNIKIEQERNLENVINVIKRSNTFRRSEIATLVYNLVMNSKISVSYSNEDVANQRSNDDLLNFIKEELAEDLIDEIINTVGTPVPGTYELNALDAPANPHRIESHRVRSCRRSGFIFRRKKCRDHIVQRRIPVEGVSRAVLQSTHTVNVNDERDYSFYRTVYQYTTLGFGN